MSTFVPSEFDIRYPAVAIGCCFYNRQPNYQQVISSIEKMATAYPGDVHAFVYLSGATSASRVVSRLTIRQPELFSFCHGPNALDEPKYQVPLRSVAEFILTIDDDCVFEADTVTRLMDAYRTLQVLDPQLNRLAAIGWFGTELVEGRLLTPIEGRYNLLEGELREVDYLGSCGALYRREVLDHPLLARKSWPEEIGAASDLWLSFLLRTIHRAPAYLIKLEITNLPEWGHSLWDDLNSNDFPAAVSYLTQRGWGAQKPTEALCSSPIT